MAVKEEQERKEHEKKKRGPVLIDVTADKEDYEDDIYSRSKHFN